MNKHVYNASLALGTALTSIGAGLVYLPAGLIVGGVLILGFTIMGAALSSRRAG